MNHVEKRTRLMDSLRQLNEEVEALRLSAYGPASEVVAAHEQIRALADSWGDAEEPGDDDTLQLEGLLNEAGELFLHARICGSKQQDYDLAAKHFVEALKQNSWPLGASPRSQESITTLLNLSMAYMRAGLWRKAVGAFENSLSSIELALEESSKPDKMSPLAKEGPARDDEAYQDFLSSSLLFVVKHLGSLYYSKGGDGKRAIVVYRKCTLILSGFSSADTFEEVLDILDEIGEIAIRETSALYDDDAIQIVELTLLLKQCHYGERSPGATRTKEMLDTLKHRALQVNASSE